MPPNHPPIPTNTPALPDRVVIDEKLAALSLMFPDLQRRCLTYSGHRMILEALN